jgi:hypothetical protein
MSHASDSTEQRAIESEIRTALEVLLAVTFAVSDPLLRGLKLDAFAPGPPPVLVEVFAHVGPSKSGQRHKVANDMTKLLLAERRLGVPCRKVIAVIDRAAIAHHKGSWAGEFAKAFGFEVEVVPGFESRHEEMRLVQQRQRR